MEEDIDFDRNTAMADGVNVVESAAIANSCNHLH